MTSLLFTIIVKNTESTSHLLNPIKINQEMASFRRSFTESYGYKKSHILNAVKIHIASIVAAIHIKYKALTFEVSIIHNPSLTAVM